MIIIPTSAAIGFTVQSNRLALRLERALNAETGVGASASTGAALALIMAEWGTGNNAIARPRVQRPAESRLAEKVQNFSDNI